MKQGWRWYGTSDPISLKEIRQAGVTDVVTALYERKPGEVWPVEEIAARALEVEKHGMRWSVVESVPVHEDIKKRCGDYKVYIENYKQTLKNLAKCGIKVVCYNFMPVLDWTRSDLNRELEDGSKVLSYSEYEVAAFDMFMLNRPGAEKDFSDEVRLKARQLYETASDAEKQRISKSILTGLPGTVDDLTVEEFREALKTYEGIDDAALRHNMYQFLNEISPVLEETGVNMAIHPDDPPHPIFGLPRILSNAADIRQMYAECPSKHVGLTLCTGSLGGSLLNDEVSIFKEFAERIYFCHFRNLVYDDNHEFRESECHLTGKIDMPRLMKALMAEEARRGEGIVVRPDHGRLMEIDKGRDCYGGYSYGGRLVGLAELRGLEAGLRYGSDVAGKVIVCTGAAGVLCSAMTEDLLLHGAKVAILDLRYEAAKAFQDELAAKGLTDTLAVEADVLNRESLQRACQCVLDKWGRVDVLINGAGGNHPKGTCPDEQMFPESDPANTFFGLEMDGFEFVNKLNLIGTLLPSQVFGKVMCDNGGGCVLNFCSMAAYQPLTKVAAYGAAKASVMNFTYWLSTHLAPMGVRVNALAPGFFITNQNRFLMLEKDEKTLTPRGKKVLAKTPMHKFGAPSDLFGAARFLLSEEASFITGVVLPVDGGFVSYSGV